MLLGVNHLLPYIHRGQMRLARPYPGGSLERAAAEIQKLDPEIAIDCLTALGTHGQLGQLQVLAGRKALELEGCVAQPEGFGWWSLGS